MCIFNRNLRARRIGLMCSSRQIIRCHPILITIRQSTIRQSTIRQSTVHKLAALQNAARQSTVRQSTVR